MRKQEIEKLIKQQEKIYQRNYQAYQETGIYRYEYTYRKAEDLIDLGEMALSAADDHQMVGIYRSELAEWGSRALELTRNPQCWDEKKAIKLLENIAAAAKLRGLVRDR